MVVILGVYEIGGRRVLNRLRVLGNLEAHKALR